MHKKLANDLTSIAHSILRMKDKDDVLALKLKAHEVYEKLALLAYVEEYINTTPNAEFSKEELIAKISGVATDNNNSFISNKTEEVLLTQTPHQVEEIQIEDIHTESDNTFVEDIIEIKNVEETLTTNIQEEIIEELQVNDEEVKFENNSIVETIEIVEEIKIDNTQEETGSTDDKEVIIEEIEELNIIENLVEQEVVFEEELPDIHTNTVTTSEIIEQPFDELESLLFEEKIEEDIQNEPTLVEEKVITLEEELGDTMPVDVMVNLFEKVEPKKTLHDKLQNTIIIGLNDRIAFVKHLFNGNQEDFNRVISQLNTLSTERAAKNFMLKMVKPDYDWSDKEEYEIRLIEIIERRFML